MRVAQYMRAHSVAETVKHFCEENCSRSTIYDITHRLSNGESTKRKEGSGRKPSIMTKRRLSDLKHAVKDRANVSSKVFARKYGCSDGYVRYAIRKLGFKCYKQEKAPAYTIAQEKQARSGCRWIYDRHKEHLLVLDDEKYFTLSSPTTGTYRSTSKQEAPEHVKFKPTKKFEKKLMIYLAISERGISRTFFVPCGLAVDQKTYTKKCLEKILIPFIKEHHGDGNYLFWPDKASSHYSKMATDCLTRNGIRFLEKKRNPTNVPQCRPIEDFRGILSGLVYSGGWTAKTMQQLKYRITTCLKNVDGNVVRSMFQGIRTKLRLVSRNGPIAANH